MKKIEIYGSTYFCHPIYDQYASSEDGHVIDILKKATHMGILGYGGYLFFNMNKKLYPVHQFIYECFHGVQPEGQVVVHIDGFKLEENVAAHIDGNKRNNSIRNLKNIEDIILLIRDQIVIKMKNKMEDEMEKMKNQINMVKMIDMISSQKQ